MKLFILLFSLSFSLFSQTTPEILEGFDQSTDKMPSTGRYKGQYVENNERRTLIQLNREEKRHFNIHEKSLAVANFRHKEKFYIAIIKGLEVDGNNRPLAGRDVVEKVTLTQKHWAGVTRPQFKSLEVHAELVFKFKSQYGIELVYNQTDQKVVPRNTVLKGATLSIEAIRSKNKPDAPFMPDALGYNFAIGHRFYSLAERDIVHDRDPDRLVNEFELNFANTKSVVKNLNSPKDALLYQAMFYSELYGRDQTYHIFYNNCTARLIDILDLSLKYSRLDFSRLDQNIHRFLNQDIKEILNFVKELEVARSLSKRDADYIINYLNDLIKLKTEDFKVENTSSSKQFLYSVPAFIEGHLQVRDLID